MHALPSGSVAQLAHAAPVAHASDVVPETHAPLASQQPLGQSAFGPQLVVHVRSTASQSWPGAQSVASLQPQTCLPATEMHPSPADVAEHASHAPPSLPHAPGMSPGTQLVPSQQPP